MALPIATPQAFALEVPRFSELSSQWGRVQVGDTPAQVVTTMGEPTNRSEWQTLGVKHEALSWLELRGKRFTARFIGGHLYLKEMSD